MNLYTVPCYDLPVLTPSEMSTPSAASMTAKYSTGRSAMRLSGCTPASRSSARSWREQRSRWAGRGWAAMVDEGSRRCRVRRRTKGRGGAAPRELRGRRTKIFVLPVTIAEDLSGRTEWTLSRTRGWSREVHSNTNEGSLTPFTYTIRRP
jgi:hypothetical protein